ncbi:hypothetical protein FJT64_011606 [Amphibalanus amphitrite]|uniref:Uncharacterized protein n=1 Tax=Amphibalanus amphitrite TaxID=1232801 RepID=A0A6A4V6D8_AMPAM|nr:hypothetical protein FJT64_011606 [Amphibalanus amphitrite]
MRKTWAEHSLGLVRPTLLEFDQWLRLQLRIQLSCEAAAPAPSQQKRTAGMFLTTKTASTSAIDERRWHPEDGRRHAAGGTAAFRGTTRRWGQQRSDDDTPLGVQRRSDDDTSLAVQRFQRVDARCRRREARRCWSRRTQRAGGD